MSPVPDEHRSLVIGKRYPVRAIEVVDWNGFSGWVPITSGEHEDSEVINYPWQHFHVDWRFVSQKIMRWYLRELPMLYAVVVMRTNAHGEMQALGQPAMKRMTYKRPWPTYPFHKAKWLPKLQEKFACASILNGKCPHRGVSVADMKRDGDILTCPAHGLRWHAVTGKLVTS